MKTKIKNLFGTTLKATLSIVCLVAILAILGTGTVYAASTIAQNSSIGAENAKKFSFADAGVDPLTAKDIETEFGYEQGQFVYEVEFISDGTEYEYWINASDGTVVKKNTEPVILDDKNVTASAQLSLEKAKEIALSDAKLIKNTVTFTTTKLDTEDKLLVYELEFNTEDAEYEYEINANTGAIYSKDREAINVQNNQLPVASAAQQSTKSAGKQDNSASTKQNNSDNRPDTNSKHNTNQSVSNKQQTADNKITLDAAKAKALADAGVSSSNITFTQAEFEYDDGITVYDIEFYTSTQEYEYEINAATGAIEDKSIESLKKNTDKKQSKTTDTVKASNSATYIGINKAKSKAVDHAGLSISSVTFSKAKLDTDDGRTVYEIEFFKDGIEYEYEIDASSGEILEYDVEQDD